MDKVFRRKNTQLNHRAKGLLGTYSQTKMWHFVLLFFIAFARSKGCLGCAFLTLSKNNASNIGCIIYQSWKATQKSKILDVLVSSKFAKQHGNLQSEGTNISLLFVPVSWWCFWNIWIVDITYHAHMSQDGPLGSSFFSIILKQQKQTIGDEGRG